MKIQTRRKLEMLGIVGILITVAYVTIKYLIPLVWPFIVAYGLARLIFPVARFLRDKLHFHRTAAAAITLISSMVAIGGALYILGQTLVEQVMSFVRQWPIYQEKLLLYVENICQILENAFKLERGTLYDLVYDSVNSFLSDRQDRLLPMVMTNSISTFKIIMDVVIVLALMVMAVFYMLKDMDVLRNIDKNHMFYHEIIYMRGLISRILKAYVRSQAIIIGVIAVVCSIGLAIIGNEYNIILGIIIGISDALPLVGVGTVLLPWSVVCIFTGNYMHAAVLLVVFVACYLIREFLEPRLMGQEIGISPISTLISIFIGYRLFGFLGMIVGPLVAVMLREILALVRSRGH